MAEYIGKNINRLDGLDKVTGKANYTHDVALPGMLYAKILRSPHAHAKILSIDVSAATALPGVKAVTTWENTPRRIFNSTGMMVFLTPGSAYAMDEYVFDNIVRHVGDEVAAVAAVSEEIAEEAIRLIKVEYELLPAVFDPMEALKEDAYLIHGDIQKDNIAVGTFTICQGDVKKSWDECDVVYENKVTLPIQKQAQLETHAAVASYVNGELTVWSPTQSIHAVKHILSHIFDLPASRVRVLNPGYVGGGFGVRVGLSGKAEAIATALSLQAKQPVKIIMSREEDFIASDTRHSGYVFVKLGAKKDGTFHALEMNAFLNTGAYGTHGIEVAACLGNLGTSIYRVPNIAYEGKSIYTNIVPAGAFRGFGNPQAVFAVETAVDGIAKSLGRDPVELRLQNIIKAGDLWPLPYPCSTTALDKCITEASTRIGWQEKHGKVQTGRFRRGVGISAGTHFCGYDTIVSTRIDLDMNGTFVVFVGNSEIGTGYSSSLRQIAAETLQCPLDSVSIRFGDTLMTPYDIGSHSTRSVFGLGNVISDAAAKLKAEVLAYYAENFGCMANQLELREGVIFGGPQKVTISEIARHAHARKHFFSVKASKESSITVPPWESHAAEVEVDILTGVIKVIKVVAAHDVGHAINPLLVEGQIEGGVLMGVGYATREEMVIDEKGRPFHSSYHTYMLPTFADIPEIEPVIVDNYEPSGPFGAKGVGECGMVPTAAAIAAAVEDAIGIRFTVIPLTPERVLAGIKNAGIQL